MTTFDKKITREPRLIFLTNPITLVILVLIEVRPLTYVAQISPEKPGRSSTQVKLLPWRTHVAPFTQGLRVPHSLVSENKWNTRCYITSRTNTSCGALTDMRFPHHLVSLYMLHPHHPPHKPTHLLALPFSFPSRSNASVGLSNPVSMKTVSVPDNCMSHQLASLYMLHPHHLNQPTYPLPPHKMVCTSKPFKHTWYITSRPNKSCRALTSVCPIIWSINTNCTIRTQNLPSAAWISIWK